MSYPDGMAQWLVYTPPYGGFDGYGSDVVTVEAPTKRAALVVGVRELRRIRSRWLQDAQSDGRSPFTGLKAEREDCDGSLPRRDDATGLGAHRGL